MKNKIYNEKTVNWMDYINDNIDIRELSIPGTHDSTSNNKNNYSANKTQSYNIKEQLKLGVRYFDLQLYFNKKKGLIDKNSKKHHIEYLNLFNNFLKDNPSEVIILNYIREDTILSNTYRDDDWENNLINDYKVFDNILYDSEPSYLLKDLRGKILIFHVGNLINNKCYKHNIISNGTYQLKYNFKKHLCYLLKFIFEDIFITPKNEQAIYRYNLYSNNLMWFIPKFSKLIGKYINPIIADLITKDCKKGIYVITFEELCYNNIGCFYYKLIENNITKYGKL